MAGPENNGGFDVRAVVSRQTEHSIAIAELKVLAEAAKAATARLDANDAEIRAALHTMASSMETRIGGIEVRLDNLGVLVQTKLDDNRRINSEENQGIRDEQSLLRKDVTEALVTSSKSLPPGVQSLIIVLSSLLAAGFGAFVAHILHF